MALRTEKMDRLLTLDLLEAVATYESVSRFRFKTLSYLTIATIASYPRYSDLTVLQCNQDTEVPVVNPS